MIFVLEKIMMRFKDCFHWALFFIGPILWHSCSSKLSFWKCLGRDAFRTPFFAATSVSCHDHIAAYSSIIYRSKQRTKKCAVARPGIQRLSIVLHHQYYYCCFHYCYDCCVYWYRCMRRSSERCASLLTIIHTLRFMCRTLLVYTTRRVEKITVGRPAW